MPKFSKKMRKPRRRLQAKGKVPTKPSFAKIIRDVAPIASKAYGAYTTYRRGRAVRQAAARIDSLNVSDNISKLPLTVIGKPRKLSFAEKVARVERPPVYFKRNYQFSAECLGGRKAWFNINLNHSTNDLYADTNTYKSNMVTDTTSADTTMTANIEYDKARFYVDYMNTKLQFMNSGSNALIGKIHLFAFKRDAKSQYNSSVPINPVNLMMYYSAFGRALQFTDQEIVVGNGWNFDTATANYNYTSNYNMPGSSINSSGVCAFTDLALGPSSTHIKQDMGFWFRPVFSQSFNLKPGQQCNKIIKFHDLPTIAREQMDMEFYAGVSYAIAVEFQGQIIGASDVANSISTGSAQLSVIREDIRILGLKNALKPKVLLRTSPLSTIVKANQIIINPDTGTQLTGYQDDA